MRKIMKTVIVGSVILASLPAFAQRQPITSSDQFIEWESKHNPKPSVHSEVGGTFEADEIDVPVMEFRIDHPNLKRIDSYMQWVYGADLGPNLVTVDFAPYLPKEVYDSLFFEKEGEKWVRWPLSPYDTEFRPIMEQYLKDLGVPYRIVHSLRGRSTASRSILNKDPNIDYEFSSKTSTNRTSQGSGDFQYRPYPARWGHLNRKLSDYYYTQKHRLKHLDVAWEAALIALPPVKNSRGKMVDAAMTVRLMDDVARNRVHHMSGFVLNHKSEVARMAKIAGISEEEFVTRCAQAFGAGLSEMHLVLGFEMRSAHLQNIRFELDKNYLPTGRIIMLDLTDGSPIRPIVEANGGAELLRDWALLTATDGSQRNPIYEFIATSGDLRWLMPFKAVPRAYNAMAEAMGKRIQELTNLEPAEARAMVKRDPRMSILWGGSTQQLILKLKPELCRDLFN